MIGNFIDTLRYSFKNASKSGLTNSAIIDTDYGKIRVFDSKGDKPVIINVPDGPNVIEHHEGLIAALSKNFRVICFEFPGFGFSHPLLSHNYSLVQSANIVINLMDILKIQRATLSFSCSNGFYALKAAELYPDRFNHVFLAQTPSFHFMKEWVNTNIPKILTYPIIGQVANGIIGKPFAEKGYKYLLPKETDIQPYQQKAIHALNSGGCNCLASLVQGMTPDLEGSLEILNVPTTVVWGKKDFTHRKTNGNAIKTHLPNCEIINFDNCGHYPELEDVSRFSKLINERLNK
jgi:pimeloyl-ACP methyl ester carboxylesterase